VVFVITIGSAVTGPTGLPFNLTSRPKLCSELQRIPNTNRGIKIIVLFFIGVLGAKDVSRLYSILKPSF
jgi:hypothetical protein